MARNINDIQETILTAIQQTPELTALEVLTAQEQIITDADSTSKVAVWRLWVWVFSFAQFIQEQYWEIFRAEIETRIAQSRIHNPKWYREKALEFLFGIPLVQDKDYYDLSVLTPQQIATAKIISNAAPVRIVQNGYGTLRLKVVRTVNGEYAPLTQQQLIALNIYFNENVADAGTVVNATTGDADLLKLKIDIYYNGLVLSADGSRLDGTDATPVINQINNYLKSIKFNGSLILDRLEKEIGKIEGVDIAKIDEAYSKYGTYNYTDIGIQNVGLINEIRPADAGYMKLDVSELLINYIPFLENE
ncbi:hypothetical protein NTJ28_001689 [Flavobacterium psychrophilum]|nr:hypothetical protein [Flavobacterium psychrophilum]EKT4510334.1 hypothetical protein [Flavobacterium psychrophilum]